VFYTPASDDTLHGTYHFTTAGEIEIRARGAEKRMALLAGIYKDMGRKPQRKTIHILALLADIFSL
jgi:hypothetical protein